MNKIRIFKLKNIKSRFSRMDKVKLVEDVIWSILEYLDPFELRKIHISSNLNLNQSFLEKNRASIRPS